MIVVCCRDLIGHKYEVDLDALSSNFMSDIYVTLQALED